MAEPVQDGTIDETADPSTAGPEVTGDQTSDQPQTAEPSTSTETPPVETTDETKGAAPSTVPAKKPKTAEDRINELVAQREYWKGRSEGTIKPPAEQTVQPPQVAAPAAGPPAKPKPEDFPDWEAYEDAKDTWLIEMGKHQAVQELQGRIAQTSQAEQVNKVITAHQDRMKKAAEEDPAIAEIAEDPTLPMSTAMRAVIMMREEGPQLIRYLHENRDEAKRIYNLAPLVQQNGQWVEKPGGNPFTVFLELGKIIGALENTPTTAKPRSKAPVPHTPVGGNNGTVVSGDLSELAKTNPDEYIKRVRAQKA